MIDKDTRAAKSFYREVRNFALNAKPWSTNVIFYDVRPSEKFEPTLISQRVYGRRDEFLAVMAAAGIDQVDQEFKQKQIILPDDTTLYAIKRRAGFESIAQYRENYAPVWTED